MSFPGFTRVPATRLIYFINRDGVVSDSQPSGDVISFIMIEPQIDGTHQMVRMATNCSSKILNLGGALYQSDGTMVKAIDAENLPSLLDMNSDLGKVVGEACRVAMEKRSFSGNFAIKSAMTALFGNFDPSTQSSSEIVRGDNGDEDSKVTVLTNSSFEQAGTIKQLLVTSTQVPIENCHACGARVGAYVFTNREGAGYSNFRTERYYDSERLAQLATLNRSSLRPMFLDFP
jgi:hypothetical protein